MDEAAATKVDAHVRRSGQVRLKEHQISGRHLALNPPAGVVLGVGRSRQLDAQHREDVLRVARAVEARRRRPTEDVRRADIAHRISRQACGDRRRPVDDEVRETADRAGSRFLARFAQPHLHVGRGRRVLRGQQVAQLRVDGGRSEPQLRRRNRLRGGDPYGADMSHEGLGGGGLGGGCGDRGCGDENGCTGRPPKWQQWLLFQRLRG